MRSTESILRSSSVDVRHCEACPFTGARVQPLEVAMTNFRVNVAISAFAVIVTAATAPGGAAQRVSSEQTDGADRDHGPAAWDIPQDDTPRRRTAEALLRELRRKRPQQHVIPPSGRSASAHEGAGHALYPEGAAVVDRVGRLEPVGDFWRFVFDPADGDPAVKLLPNATLEVLVRTARGTANPIRFVVFGEMTVFEDENYLFVRMAKRAGDRARSDRTPGDPAPSAHVEAESAHAASASDRAASGGESAVNVLAALQQQRPKDAILSTRMSPPSRRRSDPAAFTHARLPDGVPLVRRAGRVVREGPWWTFVF